MVRIWGNISARKLITLRRWSDQIRPPSRGPGRTKYTQFQRRISANFQEPEKTIVKLNIAFYARTDVARILSPRLLRRARDAGAGCDLAEASVRDLNPVYVAVENVLQLIAVIVFPAPSVRVTINIAMKRNTPVILAAVQAKLRVRGSLVTPEAIVRPIEDLLAIQPPSQPIALAHGVASVHLSVEGERDIVGFVCGHRRTSQSIAITTTSSGRGDLEPQSSVRKLEMEGDVVLRLDCLVLALPLVKHEAGTVVSDHEVVADIILFLGFPDTLLARLYLSPTEVSISVVD